MRAYYNEIDPFAAAWLRELIRAGHIPPGEVDERSIIDVRPDDLRGFTACHFFAGIGGWAYALRLAGWADDRPVWTGSCPCQPFSAAGQGGGFDDERHLWPAFFHLIEQRNPVVVFGEQVASKDGLAWLNLVQIDLEGTGYAVGAVDTSVAGFGCPGIRQRLYWVGDADYARLEGWQLPAERTGEFAAGAPSLAGGLADTNGGNSSEKRQQRSREHGQFAEDGGAGSGMEHTESEQAGISGCTRERRAPSFWAACDWIACQDGKIRPVEPGTFPLAHGIPSRMGRIRGYGNAINTQAAKAFVEAFLELKDDYNSGNRAAHHSSRSRPVDAESSGQREPLC